jgi:hypothetical protein
MKYVVSFRPRQGGSSSEVERDVKRGLAAFAAWRPAEGVTFHQFVARLDGGGYAVVEADDPALVAEGPTKFGVWFDFDVVPVIDVGAIVPIAQEAIDFRASIT